MGVVIEDLWDHEGYGARRLPDGTLTGTWTAATRAFSGFVPACGCGWHSTREFPPTEDGEQAALAQWRAEHATPLLDRQAERGWEQLGWVLGWLGGQAGRLQDPAGLDRIGRAVERAGGLVADLQRDLQRRADQREGPPMSADRPARAELRRGQDRPGAVAPTAGVRLSPAEAGRLAAALSAAHLTLEVDERQREMPAARRLASRLHGRWRLLVDQQQAAERASTRLDVPIDLDAATTAHLLGLLEQAAAQLEAFADRREGRRLAGRPPAVPRPGRHPARLAGRSGRAAARACRPPARPRPAGAQVGGHP
jgi:hypothetical protein